MDGSIEIDEHESDERVFSLVKSGTPYVITTRHRPVDPLGDKYECHTREAINQPTLSLSTEGDREIFAWPWVTTLNRIK